MKKICSLGPVGKKVFSFIITYFNKKIKFNLYAPTAIEFAEKGFHMKNVLDLRCDILGNGNLNCQSVIFFWLERKNFAIFLAIGYYRVSFKNFLDIGLMGFALKQKHMGMQTDRSPFCVIKSQFREKLVHMTDRQKQQKNRIWWNRPATQSLAAAGGALTSSFQAYEKPYDLESLSGKLAIIQNCQKQEKFCIWGVTTGNSGQDVCPRPAELGSKKKRGAVARLS